MPRYMSRRVGSKMKCKVRPHALPANIMMHCKRFTVTNTLAYLYTEIIACEAGAYLIGSMFMLPVLLVISMLGCK